MQRILLRVFVGVLLTPMTLVSLAFARGAQSSELPRMRVSLTLEQEPQLRVGVQVTVEGDADGETVMGVSKDWGGVPAGRIDLVDVSATNEAGEPLAVEANSHFEWTIQHAPGESITLSAWLLANELRASGQSSDHYRPILEPTLFQAIGHVFLPRPLLEDKENERISLTLAFQGFDEAEWEVVHSFGIGPEELEVEVTRSRLSGILIAAGKLQIHTREIRGGQLAFTLDSTRWRFDGSDFADLTAEIIDLERSYMDDDSAPFYWVGAIAVGPAQSRGFSFGGTGLTNAFALYLQPNTTISESSAVGPQVRKLLGHECFHEWNGHRIQIAAPEREHYWFSEGFTEYFGRRILHQGGLLSDETFVKMLNVTLRDYHSSPVRNMPACELGELFWTSRDGQQQPYLRGELMAILIDHAIVERSRGAQSLADFMRALLRESDGDPSLRFGTEQLLERIGQFTGPEILPRLRKMCVNGATVDLPADVLGPRFTLKMTTKFRFAPGFDVDKSRETRRITALVDGSAAQNAGLVEGDEILELNMEIGQVNIPMVLTVRSGPDGEARMVEYSPRGEPLEIPVVHLTGE